MNKLFSSALASALLVSVAIPSASFAQIQAGQQEIVVTAENQKLWDKGNKLEMAGLTEMEKAKKDLISHSANVVNAQNKRDSSQAQADNYSAQFRNLTTPVQYFSDPAEAARWARQVDKAASGWAKYDNRGGDGSSDFSKSSKKQVNAQATVDKAQIKIDKGRTMKAQAESLSMMRRP